MTQDPIQPLADMGRRVLQVASYLTTPPDQPAGSYESRLHDPLVALSDICGELLERLAVAPSLAEPVILPGEPMSRSGYLPIPDSGTLTQRRDESAGSRRENLTADRPGQEPDGAPQSEQSRHPINESGSSENVLDSREQLKTVAPSESGGATSQADSKDALRKTASSSSRPHNFQQQPSKGERDARSNEEPSAEERGSTPLVRPEAPGSDAPVDNGRARGIGASDVPPRGSRLTASTERLAAILSSHVAQPETAQRQSQEDDNVFPSPQGDDESSTSRLIEQRTRPGGLSGIEEIMERLADELETEFVRTYGRSGG